MNSYEAMVVLKPDLGKENLDKTLAQIQDVITKNGGSIGEMKDWAKQKLAYPIKKYKEGIYYLVNFRIDSGALSAIKRTFGLNESMLRTLIIKI